MMAARAEAGGSDQVSTLTSLLSGLEEGAVPTRKQIQALSMEFRTVDAALVVSLVPKQQLQSLVGALEPLLRSDEGAESESVGGEAQVERVLEAALLYLDVVTVPDMPREMLVEELVEATLALCKQELARLGAALLAASDGPPTPATARRASSSGGRKRAEPHEYAHAGQLALLFGRMPGLVATRCLNDATALRLGRLAVDAAFSLCAVLSSAPLQGAAIETLLAVFAHHPSQRSPLLHELLDLRLQIADQPGREARRTFSLSDGGRVQPFSALCLLALQRCAALPPPGTDGGEAGPSRAEPPPHPYRSAVTELASQLLRSLTSRCLDRPDDADAKGLLEEFVRDLLLLLGRPEWPAAPLVLTLLSKLLCRRMERKAEVAVSRRDSKDAKAEREEQAARLLSLDLLGQVLAAVVAQRKLHADAPLTFPDDKDEVDEAAQPTDAGEDATCVCGRGYDGGFMLDCDRCHRWFHGSCVGIEAQEDDLPSEWFCESCQLSRAVTKQRTTISRLLSLAEGGGGPSEETVDALCSEEEVTKQLLLNFLEASSAEPAAAASAHALLLCQWHFDASEQQQPGQGGAVLCRLYEEQQAAHALRCRGPHELRAAHARSVPLLSRERILSASRKLLVGSALLRRLETLLAYVLLMLKEPQSSARTKAIRAISGVVTADPSTLELAGVKQAVHLALSEPSIAVREATLDLIGQHILSQPQCVPIYYEAIVKRLGDVGISVRKRVVRILRDLCLKEPGSPHAVDACRRLVSRVVDEEEVQKLALRAFHELWFLPSSGEQLSADESAARCKQILSVSSRATRQSSEWLRQLLRKLVTPPAEGRASLKEHATVLRVCGQLVSQLKESLLQLHEAEAEAEAAEEAPAAAGGARLAAAAANAGGEAQLEPLLHALSLFCAARPELVAPHIELLPTYLQYDSYAPVVHHVCDMLPLLLPLLDAPRRGLLEKLERLLGALVFRVPEALLGQTIAALCAVVAKSRNCQLLHELLSRFCQMMVRASEPAEASRLRDQLLRSVLSAGLLCRHFDFEAPGASAEALRADGTAVRYGGDFTRTVFEQLHAFVPIAASPGDASAAGSGAGGLRGDKFTIALYALKAIGHVTCRRHDLLLACRATLAAALGRTAAPQLRVQALSNLSELVRQPAGGAKVAAKVGKEGREGREASQLAADASAAASGALQGHQAAILSAMGDARHAAVRREALQLTRGMLEQGLIHPMACIPQLMALEVDTSRQCASLAKEALRALFERHAHMVSSPGVQLQAFAAAHTLQAELAALAAAGGAGTPCDSPGAAKSPGGAPDEAEARLPRLMFELLLPQRRERLGYLKAVVSSLYYEQLGTAENAGRGAQLCERAAWVAQALSALPYEKEEDLLHLVFQINRQLSLHAESTLSAFDAALGGGGGNLEPAAAAAELGARAAAAAAAGGEQSAALELQAQAGSLACLLLLLKRHLKGLYQLSSARCQAYEPADTSSAATSRLAVRPLSRPPLEVGALRRLPPRYRAGAATSSKGGKAGRRTSAVSGPSPELEGAELTVARYLWLRELLQADDEELDFNLLAASNGTAPPTPRPKSGGAKRGRGSGSGGGGSGRGGSKKKKKKGGRKKRKGGAARESDEESVDDSEDEDYVG